MNPVALGGIFNNKDNEEKCASSVQRALVNAKWDEGTSTALTSVCAVSEQVAF